MKRIAIHISIFHFAFCILDSSASVPLKWTVETSRLQPAVFDVVRGETLALEATFNSYGRPLATSNETAFLCWQTNGMKNAWWVTNAVTAASVARVLFTPSMDPGAPTVSAFIGLSSTNDSNILNSNIPNSNIPNSNIPNSNILNSNIQTFPSLSYRAAFTLRFRHGPGASPNAIDLPPRILDLAHTVVVNPPWPTQADFAATTSVMRAELKGYVDDQIEGAGVVTPQGVTNIVDDKIAAIPKEGVSTNAVSGIITNHVASGYLCTVAAAQAMTNGGAVAYADATFRTLTDNVCHQHDDGVWYVENKGYYYDFDLSNIHYDGSKWWFKIRMDEFWNLSDVYHVGSHDITEITTASGLYGDRYMGFSVRLRNYKSTVNQPFVTYDNVPSTNGLVSAAGATNAAEAVVAPVETKVDQALLYASGIYQFMTGNTNAWFSGTNYVTTADVTNRTHFAWEDGMDAATVPCSMSLWEVRNGQRQSVWDQRDWTAWYWNFKSSQLSNSLAAATAALAAEVNTNCMRRGWAKYTAVNGLDNPDPTSTWLDTPKLQLFAGHQWEKLVETGGAGYWTLTGNGIELSASDATNTFLTVKDFEGNACLTFRKTSSYLVYCNCGTDITTNFIDNQGRVVFHLTTDVQPTAEFSTALELDSFVDQDDAGCPANCEWTGSAGSWDCHFLLKTGIVSQSCFARFKIMRQGQNVVEHTIPIKLNGGIVFDHSGQSVKIVPTVSSTTVGSTVTWVVAQ